MLKNSSNVLAGLATLYSFLAVLTVILLGIFSVTKSQLATKDAWVHAIIVVVFAVVVPVRANAARNGNRSALRATGIIASVLFLVNIIEGLVPNFMPMWIRADMFVVATLMACIIGTVINISLSKENE